MIIAACNVNLTSWETQPPAEEGTRSYKMEIAGESFQSSCQKALPLVETAMISLQGCFTPGPVLLICREATRACHTGLWPSAPCGKHGVFCKPQFHSGLSEKDVRGYILRRCLS